MGQDQAVEKQVIAGSGMDPFGLIPKSLEVDGS